VGETMQDQITELCELYSMKRAGVCRMALARALPAMLAEARKSARLTE